MLRYLCNRVARLEVGFASCALDVFVEALLGTSCGRPRESQSF